MGSNAKTPEQDYTPTGWTFQTEGGLSMSAVKGSVDGVVRLVGKIKGEHGDRNFWFSSTPATWERIEAALSADLAVALDDYRTTAEAMEKHAARVDELRSRIDALDKNKDIMDEDGYKNARVRLLAQYADLAPKE